MSSDLLLDRPLSLTTGFTSVAQNIGDMKNSGIEIDLGIDIIQTSEAFLGVNFNTTTLKNEITYLPEPKLFQQKRENRVEISRNIFFSPGLELILQMEILFGIWLIQMGQLTTIQPQTVLVKLKESIWKANQQHQIFMVDLT